MKRIATMALAAATFVAPLGTPMTASAQDWRHNDGRYDRDRDHDGRWDRDRDRDRDYNRRCDRDRDGDCDRRDRRISERWDRGRHNGYTYQGRWYYGPPPATYSYYEPGYRSWRRGDRVPAYYRNYYSGVDYRAYRLREPPRGYRWVRDDRGEFLLIGIATGVILSTIINNGRY